MYHPPNVILRFHPTTREDNLICFHILDFGKDTRVDQPAWVAGAENHIVGRPEESLNITIGKFIEQENIENIENIEWTDM